ncbi:UNVERIFIED_CONTAM: hypothetical protein FKN15_045590 [Acipenser sinensis]
MINFRALRDEKLSIIPINTDNAPEKHEVGVTSLGDHIPGTAERYTWLQTVKAIL